MSMALSVWNPKGGVGKTTIALNLAGYYAKAGHSVLVVDLDPQGGSLTFAGLAATAHEEDPKRTPVLPFDVAKSQSKPYDVVIYDHPPTMDLHIPAPFVVVPTLLDAGSLTPTIRGLQELGKLGKGYLLVPNRYDPNSSQQRQIYEGNFAGSPFIRQRMAFATCYGRGLTLYSPVGGAVPNRALAVPEFNKIPETIAKTLEG